MIKLYKTLIKAFLCNKNLTLLEKDDEARSGLNYAIQIMLVIWLLSNVQYSNECRMKRYFQYAELLPFFRAVLKKYVDVSCIKNKYKSHAL